MSSCFFSSRLKMRISRSPELRKRRTTALPNEPVPPVISRVWLSNMPRILSGRPEQKTVAPDAFDEQQAARWRDRLVRAGRHGLGLVAGGGEQPQPLAMVAK